MTSLNSINFHLRLPESWIGFKKNMENELPRVLIGTAEKTAAVARAIFSTCIDIMMLPIALIYLAIARVAKVNFNPVEPKTDKTPILLLHGSGYNQTEWIVGRQFLDDDRFGSVFSVDYAGLLSNDPQKGIDDYAAGKVRKTILKIKELTGKNQIILIGHSMGGLIAGYYAEEFAEEDNVEVQKIITIGSPWQGSPLIDFLENFRTLPKNLTQMKVESTFLKTLCAKALESDKAGKRKYYNIGSTTDFMVPSPYSRVTESSARRRAYSCLGHYGLIISPKVWWQIRSWLN